MITRTPDLAPTPTTTPLCRVLAQLTGRKEAVRAWLAGLAHLARAEGALSLRVARICAWLRRQDLAPLGFSSWTSFAREHVEWRGSWLGDLIRLVESPLDRVKQAASLGEIPLRDAVLAPRQATLETEEEWLARALAGEVRPDPPVPLVPVGPDEVRNVRQARRLARLLRGRDEPTSAVDDWILARWRAKASALELLEEAHAPRPRPEPRALTWCEAEDPATEIVGPWKDPASLDEALAQLQDIQAVLRTSIVVLGVAWDDVVHHCLWHELGLPDADAVARTLGRSARSLQRYRRLGRQLGWHDEVRKELLAGTLDLDRATFAMDAAWINPVEPWVELARRVSGRELGVIARRARTEGRAARAPYEATTVAGDEKLATRPSPRDERPDPRSMRIDPDLPRAAAWLLETVEIPPQRGFGRVKERDGFACQNPLCGRRALRNHAHHLVLRSEGGSDEASNGITACAGCHLRLVHAGHVAIERDGPDLVWSYPRGLRVRVLRGAP